MPASPKTSAAASATATAPPHRHNHFECSTSTRPGRYPHGSRACALPHYAVAIARSRQFFLLAIAVLALAAPAPVQAHFSGRKAIWGPGTVDGVSQFPVYRDLGVGIYETQVRWDLVAPTRPRRASDPSDPAYRWPADLSDSVAQARRYGMRVLFMVIGAPPWANGGHGWNFAPRRPADYADFVRAAARRYPSVHLWMVWSEPSRVKRFAPLHRSDPAARTLTRRQSAAPRLYARILDAAYGALKGVSRRNLVIGGNTYTTGDIKTGQWINYMRLPGGGRPRLDLYGHNPFSFRRPNLANPPGAEASIDFSDLGRLGAMVDRGLSRRRGQHIPLFLSEFTIPTGPDSEFNFYTELSTQADWIRAAFRIVHRWPRIYALGWIHVRDDPPGGSAGGLLDARGDKKPGYYAFRAG